MRRVLKFKDSDKSANVELNDWLTKNPNAALIDIKPLMSKTNTVTIFAIVDVPEKTKNETEEIK